MQALVGQAAQPVLDDLLQLLLAELGETQDPTEHAELAVRMAMLLWDGQGKADGRSHCLARHITRLLRRCACKLLSKDEPRVHSLRTIPTG